MSNLPEFINAIQSLTYNTADVRKALQDEGLPSEDEDVTYRIETWAAETFGWGDFILLGPDGEELDA